MIDRVCVMCGAAFKVYPSWVRRGAGFCCSSVCRNRRIAARNRVPVIERFWRNVQKTETCWLWMGSKTNGGYGQITDDFDRNLRTHRCSWEIHFGPIPDDMHILHTCDNPACVNPDHLFLGDDTSNYADSRAKNRHAHGERHGQAKLTEPAVLSIRAEYAAGGISMQRLADKHHVSQNAIRRICNGDTWRHLLP